MATDVVDVIAEAERRPITVDITTIGRTSGRPRRIEIWVVAADGHAYIGGTPRPRDWLANLMADPRLVVHLKGEPMGMQLDLPALATEVTDPAVRRSVWNHASTGWYREQCSVDDLVAHAPLVAVTFQG